MVCVVPQALTVTDANTCISVSLEVSKHRCRVHNSNVKTEKEELFPVTMLVNDTLSSRKESHINCSIILLCGHFQYEIWELCTACTIICKLNFHLLESI